MGSSDTGLPPLAVRLIRTFCRESFHEEILGNLEEYYHLHQRRQSRLWPEVIRYLRPSFFKRISVPKHRTAMFIFNPRIAVRNLQRQGINSIINITGFTTGLLCVFFLYFYASGELSYDTFHEDYDKIYRVLRTSQVNGTGYRIGVTSAPYAEALKNDFGDRISATCRVLTDEGLVRYGERRFLEKKIIYADQNFFTFFSFPLRAGNPQTVLNQTNSAVLTPRTATKYFGDEDPMGKVLDVDGESFIVTGIAGKLPARSHLEFDLILSIGVYEKHDWMHSWWNNNLATYALIESPASAAYLESRLDDFMYKYMGKDFEESTFHMGLVLEPLAEVYFNNLTRYDTARHGDRKSVYILMMVAMAILFIACFNYVNMAVALSFKRAKEIGVRKILGSSKSRLILQLLGESLLVILAAVLTAALMSHLMLPVFNGWFGVDVTYDWTDRNVGMFVLSLVASVVLLSGVYPALLLSSFKPLNVLKGHLMTNEKGIYLRKGLVIAQFVIAIFLISVTFLIALQIRYMKNKDLGFDHEAILIVDLNNEVVKNNIQTFKDRLLAHPDILSASGASGEPGGYHDAGAMEVYGVVDHLRVRTVVSDYDYLKTFDIDLIAGRDFDRSFGSDTEKAIILNRKAIDDLGLRWEGAIGRNLKMPLWFEGERTIIGIVENYHFQSLQNPVEPLAILPGEWNRMLAVKLNPKNPEKGIEHLSAVWNEMVTGYPLTYEFLERSLNSLYANERQQHVVFTSFSIISLFLACLGIFGLVSYAVQRRQKEFGIRKVLGASVSQILTLISREFVLLIIVSFLIAAPLAWLLVKAWLASFSYRILMENYWYIFLASGAICLAIAVTTISIRSFRVAASNPSDSIRYE